MKKIVYAIASGVLLLGVVTASSCSAGNGAAADAAARAVDIKLLERQFEDPRASSVERLHAATELVRSGAADSRYARYIEDAARAALLRDEFAARMRQGEDSTSSTAMVERIADRSGRTSANAPLVGTSKNLMTEAGQMRAIAAAELRSSSVPSRELDASEIVAIHSLAKSNLPGGRDELRAAVEGTNVLLASQAALGLANLKDHEWVPRIALAGRRFHEPYLFARALVYFGTTEADEFAKNLLHDRPKLFAELKKTARERDYKPFGTK